MATPHAAAERGLVERTARLLRQFEGDYPRLPQVAAMLDMHPRTLRRKLSREGPGFQRILDDVRAAQATRYLKNTALPVASVARLVGFNDPSNFRHVYIKWTGMTPSEARARR